MCSKDEGTALDNLMLLFELSLESRVFKSAVDARDDMAATCDHAAKVCRLDEAYRGGMATTEAAKDEP